jgi:hypothetical protein
MNCRNFKDWFENGGAGNAGDLKQAMHHVEDCRECRRLYQLDAEIERRIKAGFPVAEPPGQLYQRIEMDIMPPMVKKSGFWINQRYIVPTFVFLTIFLLWVFLPIQPAISIGELGGYALVEHLNADMDMDFRAGDISDLSVWFSRHLHLPDEVQRLKARGLSFLGGRKCVLGGKDVVYLFYEKDGRKVSLFIMDAADVASKRLKEIKRCHIEYEKGNEIEIWKDRNMICTMVY